LLSSLWGAVVRDRRPLGLEVDNDEVNAILFATTPNIGFYVAVIALAVFARRVAAFGFLVIAIVGVLRERGDEPAPPAAKPA
jgi:hypothetical protein